MTLTLSRPALTLGLLALTSQGLAAPLLGTTNSVLKSRLCTTYRCTDIGSTTARDSQDTRRYQVIGVHNTGFVSQVFAGYDKSGKGPLTKATLYIKNYSAGGYAILATAFIQAFTGMNIDGVEKLCANANTTFYKINENSRYLMYCGPEGEIDRPSPQTFGIFIYKK